MGDETQNLQRDVAFARFSGQIITQLEHVVAELAEYGQNMKAVTQKLDSISTDLAAKTVRMEKIDDIDKRVNTLEKNFWKATGVLSFIAAAIPILIEVAKMAMGSAS